MNKYKFEVSKYPHEYSSDLLIPYTNTNEVKDLVNRISDEFGSNYKFVEVSENEMKNIKNTTIIRNSNYENRIIPFCIESNVRSGVNIVLNGNINYNSRSVTYLLYNSYYRKVSNGKEIKVQHMRMHDVYYYYYYFML